MHTVDVLNLVGSELGTGHAVPLFTHTLTLDILALIRLFLAFAAQIFVILVVFLFRIFLNLFLILPVAVFAQPVPTPIKPEPVAEFLDRGHLLGAEGALDAALAEPAGRGDCAQWRVHAVEVGRLIAHLADQEPALITRLHALLAGFAVGTLPVEAFAELRGQRRLVAIPVHDLATLSALKGVVKVGDRHWLPEANETFSYVLTIGILLFVLALLHSLRL